MKFSEVQAEMARKGYLPDWKELDRMMVENRYCHHCTRSRLTYQGFSNADTYHAFGFCLICDYAERFWTEDASTTVGDLFGYKPQSQEVAAR